MGGRTPGVIRPPSEYHLLEPRNVEYALPTKHRLGCIECLGHMLNLRRMNEYPIWTIIFRSTNHRVEHALSKRRAEYGRKQAICDVGFGEMVADEFSEHRFRNAEVRGRTQIDRITEAP